MEANRSYRDVLRNRHVAGLLLGDLLANVGTGMIIVAMPVQTLSIHGNVPKAIAIGLVEAAPFVLSTILALSIGLGRVRVPPRTLLITDYVLRSLTFATLGVLAVTDQLTLQVLIIGLLFGATFRMAGSSGRRLLATSMAGETGRFAVNGLLGLNATFALYIVGPVLGGVIVATTSAGVALIFDACGALILLAAVLISVPRAVKDRDALRPPTSQESGWRILRRRPVAARLLVIEFFFNSTKERDHGPRPLWGCPRWLGNGTSPARLGEESLRRVGRAVLLGPAPVGGEQLWRDPPRGLDLGVGEVLRERHATSGRTRRPGGADEDRRWLPATEVGSRPFLDPLARFMIRRGLAPGAKSADGSGLGVLEVRGRKTGRRYQQPVAVAAVAGRGYIVSLWGESRWARNLCAGPTAQLRVGRRPEPVEAHELEGVEEKAALMLAISRQPRPMTSSIRTGLTVFHMTGGP